MSKGVIICVDDELGVLLSLRDQLVRIVANDYTIELANSGAEALELFAELTREQIEIPLVICDQTMPEMEGVTLLSQLHHHYPRTLKVLLTGWARFDDVIQAVNQANLYRYISKPWDETDLGLTVREALRRYEQETQLAEQNRLLHDMNRDLHREITDRQRVEAQLAHAALHDSLTGLPNRACLMQRIEQMLQTVRQHPDTQFAVLFIDLDRFKIVNDSLGHLWGDRLLIGIAQRLRQCVRESDLVARLGGDEFTVLLENISSLDEVTQIAERILDSLSYPFFLKEQMHFASASIGVVIGSATYGTATDLLRDADLAMYGAKETGRSRYTLFNRELHTQTLKLLQFENDLHQALERQELVLHYQPIVALETETLVGFEALVRWQHPQRGLIAPEDFLPFAEETGWIIPIGTWVLREACRQLHQWQCLFPEQAALTVSVNLAAQQFWEPSFIERLDDILAETQINSRCLHLELTESMLINDVETMLQTMKAIRARNIQLSIDDFGTGYSSLSYLPRFPINALKIDRTFISQMALDADNCEVVQAIATLAHGLGVDLVAEGIESLDAVALLKTMGCQLGQGYLFSPPLDRFAVENRFLRSPKACSPQVCSPKTTKK